VRTDGWHDVSSLKLNGIHCPRQVTYPLVSEMCCQEEQRLSLLCSTIKLLTGAERTECPQLHAWSPDDTRGMALQSAIHHSSLLTMTVNPAEDAVVAGGECIHVASVHSGTHGCPLSLRENAPP